MPEKEHDYDALPPFARIGEIAIALTLVVAVAAQRDALLPPGWPLLLALAAAAPFVLDSVGVRVPFPVSTAVVLGAVLLLVVNPVNLDMAPFFLVLLGGHHALAGAWRQSIVAVVGSLAVMIGVEVAGRYHGALPYLLGVVIAWAWGFAVRKQYDLIVELKAAQADLVSVLLSGSRGFYD